MTTFEKQARQIADAVVDTWVKTHGGRNYIALADVIFTALASASKAAAGCVRDEHGVERKVLGTLPTTKDGVIVVEPSFVWWWDGKVLLKGAAAMKVNPMFADPNDPTMTFIPHVGIAGCFATEEAALQSAGGEKS